MLAIPLDMKESTKLSKLFGKAPYFAILDTKTGNFDVVENEAVGKGPKSASFLKQYNVTSTIFYHMGEGVYNSFVKEGMDVYSSSYNEYPISQIFENYLAGSLQKLDESNYDKLLDPGEGEKCTCGCSN